MIGKSRIGVLMSAAAAAASSAFAGIGIGSVDSDLWKSPLKKTSSYANRRNRKKAERNRADNKVAKAVKNMLSAAIVPPEKSKAAMARRWYDSLRHGKRIEVDWRALERNKYAPWGRGFASGLEGK